MFVLRRGSCYVCQIDGSRFACDPNNAVSKDQARLTAQAHADEIVSRQTTELGMPPDASLGERQRRLGELA